MWCFVSRGCSSFRTNLRRYATCGGSWCPAATSSSVSGSVRRRISHCPWQRAVADALERHVSTDAAMGIRGAFALGDREELRALITAAGFRAVRIRIDSQIIRYPSLEEFVPGYLSATPVSGVAATLDEPTRAAILREIKTSLQPYLDDDGLAAPIEAHVVVADKS